MKMLKKVMVLMIVGVLLTGCNSKQNNDSETTNSTANTTNNTTNTTDDAQDNNQNSEDNNAKQEIAGWEIEIEESMREKKLEDISLVLGYAEVDTKEFIKEAAEGNEFFLIKMQFNKNSGSEKIIWDNLTLTDQDGNIYTRMEDSYLSDLNMKRLTGTDLNFGNNEGWIAFEINDTATDLVLEYSFESDKFTYNLK